MPDQQPTNQPPLDPATVKAELANLLQEARTEQLYTRKPKLVPNRWGNRTTASYYKEEFARELQPVVDAMLEEGPTAKPRIFKYAAFPNISHGSLYVKISQSFQYLMEVLDSEDNKYKLFRDRVELKKKHELGIVMVLKKHPVDPNAPAVGLAAGVETFEETPKETKAEKRAREAFEKRNAWKDDLELWLQSAEVGMIFHAKNLQLTADDIASTKLEFMTLREYLVKVTQEEVKIARIDPENPFAKK